ncbi:pyrroloquinoline quinone-dependent dehydrogenase [Amorphus sp. MBR-141]
MTARRHLSAWPLVGALLLPVLLAATPARAQGWSTYGGAPGGGQYSAATQITPDNVDRLEVAWTFRTGDFSDGGDGTRATTFEANPIYADGRLYVCTPYNRVIAVEAETGRQLWSFEPDPPLPRDYDQQHSLICRGVSYWDGGGGVGEPCARRIIAPVLDGRLLALDAATGTLCTDFGTGGVIDLNDDYPRLGTGVVNVTSPPVIFEDLAIVGTAIGDNQTVDMPDGVVRAFDVRTGAEKWAWNPIPDRYRAKSGAANAWAPMSLDPETATLFVPTTSPSPDYWGGDRSPNLEATNAVAALDARSGSELWVRQLTHHDLFDTDLPAQPVVADQIDDGTRYPAVVQATKTGQLFVLDRDSGAFRFETREQAVPQTDVPGEHTSPTQPVPVLPKPIATQGFAPRDAWGITPIDREWCRQEAERYRADGLFTPPSVRGSVQMPFYGGGSNWGGVAFDPVRRLVIGNVMNLVQWVRLIPAADDPAGSGELGRQKGAPYMMRRGVLLSPLGIPCNAPPWGQLTAIDIDTGATRWQVPLGEVPLALGLTGPEKWGSPNIGGPIATATGLVFIAATMDSKIRAFNAWTGEIVWEHEIPFDGAATPMTFVSERDGRQYLVIAAGGSSLLRKRLGDALVAFRLPKE